MGFTDQDGTPPYAFYGPRVHDRIVAEMLGMCSGVICDGCVTDGEVSGLNRWVKSHPDVVVEFPGNILFERLSRILADGRIDADEREELREMLLDVTGETETHDEPFTNSTRLAFDNPPPTLLFDGWEYVFTGKMLYGTRAECERAVTDRGGYCHKNIRAKTDVLVVGTMASPAWIASSFGGKIEDAVARRAAQSRPKVLATMSAAKRRSHRAIKIVSEEHWISQLELA